MLKMVLIAAAFTVAGASVASAQGWRDGNGDGYQNGHAPYGFGGTSVLGRYCPAGLYPAPYPNGDGIRCEPVGGTTQYIQGY